MTSPRPFFPYSQAVSVHMDLKPFKLSQSFPHSLPSYCFSSLLSPFPHLWAKSGPLRSLAGGCRMTRVSGTVRAHRHGPVDRLPELVGVSSSVAIFSVFSPACVYMGLLPPLLPWWVSMILPLWLSFCFVASLRLWRSCISAAVPHCWSLYV